MNIPSLIEIRDTAPTSLSPLVCVTTIKQAGHPATKSNCQMDLCGLTSAERKSQRMRLPEFAASVTLQRVLDNALSVY